MGKDSTITELLRQLSKRIKHDRPPSENDLVKRWVQFVLQIENGYVASIYDYTNDLSIRDVLEDLIRESVEPDSDRLLSAVRPWDERFAIATHKTEQALLGNSSQKAPQWWWYRLPKILCGELREDIASEDNLR